MLKLYIGRNAGRTVCLTLPVTADETGRAFAELGGASSGEPVLIQEARTSVPYLGGWLKGLSYEKKENRRELDFLAKRIGYLTQAEQDVFSAVLQMEEPGTLGEVINLSYNLDQYEVIPHGTDQAEISGKLLEKDKGIRVSVEITGFLDHERVSSSYFLRHKGAFSPIGLVLKKEGVVPEEVYGNGRHTHPGYEKGSLLLLHLYFKGSWSPNGEYVLSVPASGERIRLIINLEAQNKFLVGYPLIKRAIFYCGRMISSQYGTEFTNSQYGKIKKVYSIWVCVSPPKEMENTITRYHITEENMVGKVHLPYQDYDLMTVILLCLGNSKDENYNGILKLLGTLLSSETAAAEKQQILKHDFGIPMTEAIEREVFALCNLSEGVEARGIEKGRVEGIFSALQNLMDSMGLSIEQAMNVLKIAESERPKYRSMLGSQ